MLINARSVKSESRKTQLETLIASFPVLPVLIVTETWLTLTDTNVILPCFKSYNIYRCDRESKRGGGVLIMIPNEHKCYEHKPKYVNDNFEVVWCKLMNRNQPIEICAIYRPPGNPQGMPDMLINYLNNNLSKNTTTIIAGDFNYPHIINDDQNDFVDFLVSLGMQQLVTFPTRGHNVLDLIFCNEPNLIQNITEAPNFIESDHKTICGEIRYQSVKSKTIYYRDYDNADFQSINIALAQTDWHTELPVNTDVNNMYTRFLAILQEKIDMFVPIKKVIASKTPHCSSHVRKLIRKANKSHKHYKANKTEENRQKSIEASRIAQREKRREQKEREERMLGGSTRNFWDYIRSRLNYKSSIPCLVNPTTNVPTNDNKERAEILNKYFASVFTRDDLNPTQDSPDNSSEEGSHDSPLVGEAPPSESGT